MSMFERIGSAFGKEDNFSKSKEQSFSHPVVAPGMGPHTTDLRAVGNSNVNPRPGLSVAKGKQKLSLKLGGGE